MAVDCLNKWTPSQKPRGIPSVSTRFSLSIEIGQAGGGRDAQTCPARPNSQVKTGTGNCPADHEHSIGNLTRLIHALLYVMIILKYITTASDIFCMTH